MVAVVVAVFCVIACTVHAGVSGCQFKHVQPPAPQSTAAAAAAAAAATVAEAAAAAAAAAVYIT